MDNILVLLAGYIVLGIFLVWISARLTRRIPWAVLRAAIPAAVFAVWFAPGPWADGGGACLAPILMIFCDKTGKLISNSYLPFQDHAWEFHVWSSSLFLYLRIIGVVWVISFGMVLATGYFLGRWREKEERQIPDNVGARNKQPVRGYIRPNLKGRCPATLSF